MRRLLVAGNWKMHGSYTMTSELIVGIADAVNQADNQTGELNYDILVCPPHCYLGAAVSEVQANSDNPIFVGAQNVSDQLKGAFTGEISLDMLADIECRYVLLGHSERREIYSESDAVIAQKFAACIAHESGITPILCVGETLSDRQAGNTQQVVQQQIDAVLSKVGIEGFKHAIIAYEPVWAIGTGETATPEQAQEVHAFIRQYLAELDSAIAENIKILYGGSVKPSNAPDLFKQTDIDGGLIGGASLDIGSFAGICAAAQALSQ